MNPYLKNLNKIEFVVTDVCTGRCKHCSQGDHSAHGESIAPTIAADAVRKIAAEYNIQTVMTFGGEPLLCPEVVCAIMATATELNILRRQVITNGFFSRDGAQIRLVAERLFASGVNDLLLSVDAFHQETIPLDAVRLFAKEAVSCGVPMRLQPAWLVSPTDENPYNRKTKEILGDFADLKIPTGEGNVIFPEGNALAFLTDYFADEAPENPYVEDPRDVRCVSVSSNGDVLGGNLNGRDVMEILATYTP